MSQGNRICLTPAFAIPVEGIINAAETPKPGTIMQYDPSQTRVGGRLVWKAYSRDADGNRPKGPFVVLTEDIYQGRTMSDAYAAGERCFGVIPLPGCELNLLFGNAAGTADDVVAGELLIVDSGTGKLVPTTGSPETEVAQANEALTDPTADALLWCNWTGY